MGTGGVVEVGEINTIVPVTHDAQCPLGGATHYGKCHYWDLPTGREITGLRASKPKR